MNAIRALTFAIVVGTVIMIGCLAGPVQGAGPTPLLTLNGPATLPDPPGPRSAEFREPSTQIGEAPGSACETDRSRIPLGAESDSPATGPQDGNYLLQCQ